jgi:Flp pilus assembly protein TadG
MASLRRRRGERGAAAVEFALVSVIMLGLVVAIIQVSIWFWSFQVGGHAAREGARAAAVDARPCNDVNVRTLTTSRVGAAAQGAPTVAVSRVDNDGRSGITVGDEITVDVRFAFHPIGPLGTVFPAIHKTATSRVENIPSGIC